MSNAMRAGSLFDRLEHASLQPRSMKAHHDLPARITAIKRNVECLLNTRQGCSQSSPGVGLPDFNDAVAGSADLLLRTTRGIRESIEAYEPRLVVRDVHFVPNPCVPLELNFRLHCALAVDSREAVFEVELAMNGHNRHYSVR